LLAMPFNTGNNAAARAIADLGHGAGAPSAAAFLKRAATLHADATAYLDRTTTPATASTASASSSNRDVREVQFGNGGPTKLENNSPVPLLLVQDRVALNLDGQVIGETVAAWHWPFARGLLDLMNRENAGKVDGILNGRGRPKPATDAFVGMWYHASAAAMFASGAYAELTPHLQHAAEILPGDVMALFDRGCYAELLGLPMHQVLISDREAMDRRRDPSGSGPSWHAPTSQQSLRIPAAETTNAEAERLYRESLAIDSSLTEVRVRLARLLDRRGRTEAAATELNTAIAGRPDGAVAYYAHLFAGRASQSLGRMDEAAKHYQSARELFPDAQSALLAASQLALLSADVDGTVAPIDRLPKSAPDLSADPWWIYHHCAGRDADELLRVLWSAVKAIGP
jgi:tetratricopeptide (TPR) repeat protein